MVGPPVADATTGDGLAGAPGTEDLWQAMIDAGHDEDGYNMSAGAAFLEELMVMLDSDDAAASVGFMLAVMTFADEFPIPNVMEEFQDIPGYLATFDLIENFTRFEGTGDFEAAYNAMTGSSEWSNITEALDDLAEQRRIFQSIETLMHNIALLAVSTTLWPSWTGSRPTLPACGGGRERHTLPALHRRRDHGGGIG